MKNIALFASTLLLAATVSAQAQGCMADVQKKGLTVGTSPDYPPFESLDNSNQIVGFDVDMINAVGKKLGLKVNIVGQSFDGLIPALVSRKIDVIAAGMTVTPERRKAVNFTLPYDNSENVILARKENLNYSTAASLGGKSVGVQIGSTQEKLAQGIKGANVKSFNLYTDAAVALQTRQIDSVVIDRVVGEQFVKNYPDFRLTGKLSKNEKALAVRKDCSDLVNRINAAVIDLRKSGELPALTKKWLNK